MNTKVAIAALLIALLAGTRASAQVGENTGETQQLQRRCSTVAVMSEVPGLPAHDLYTSLKRRPDFQISKLVPVGDPELADATIHLGVGTDGGTQIVVTNRWTKERAGSNSNWSRYPGMIAMDAMSSLEMVCPGSVRKVPSNSSASAACALQPAVHPVTFHTISACSHTSWIGNRELYAALQADSQLKAMGVELLPACTTTADVQLQVTHNLEQTEDWTWQLNAATDTH
jgi:hypothetical protein